MRYIETLREGERISEVYLCKYKQSAVTKAGKPYDNVILQDKTGTIDAKIWEPGSAGIDEFDAMDYVEVTGEVTNYQGNLQFTIKRARVVSAGDYDMKEYLPTTDKDVEEMYAELTGYIATVSNKYLNRLLNMFFGNEKFARAFKSHSAAKSVHHGFVGGLLEHTVSVARNCDYIAKNYPFLNRNLLMTAAIFHDIGKLKELSAFPENDYTDAGQLLGHIVIGVEWIGDAIREIEGFPQVLASELKHCILAHHGELEFGSPKKPALAEALALAFADNLDAKMETFRELLVHVPDNNLEWQGFNRLLDSNIRKTSC